jgi:hypothetical protein
MKRILSFLLLALLGASPAFADVYQATYGVAKVFPFWLYNADGTYDVDEADSGTEVSLSCNQGAETTATNDFVDEGTHYSISLTAAELQCQTVVVVVNATVVGGFIIQTEGHASAFKTITEANVATVAAGAINAAAIANAAIDEAAYAADTAPRFGILTSGTAQSGSTGTTLVLASAADFTADNRITGATCAITGGTGSGEALTVASYVNSTDTATMGGTWPTTPDNTSTYTCYRSAPGSSAGGLDAAGVRAAVGLASANLDTQLDALPTAAENTTANWAAGTRTLTALDEDNTAMDLNATTFGTVNALGANAITAAATAVDFTTEVTAALATAAALSTLQTSVNDVPTNSELNSALAALASAGVYSLGYKNAGGDSCVMVISESTPNLNVTCTEAP